VAVPVVTSRCDRDLERLPRDIADDIVDKFILGRTLAPETGERIRDLIDRPCYSLHAGRYRAATWYDRARDVVWLLAAGVHREDSPEDFYQEVARLEHAGQLYPADSDHARVGSVQRAQRLKGEAADLRRLREQALGSPDGGRLEYTSPHGLYAQVWAETVPGLALLALRVRIARRTGLFIADFEWALILSGPLTAAAEQKDDPDGDWKFRYFEEYVAL
jgi:hypothetical protein